MSRPRVRSVVAACVGLVTAHVVAVQHDGAGRWVGVLDEHPAIEYATRPVHDAVARLNDALEHGAASLAFDGERGGYLPAVLAALRVPVESQMLVLSRTGVQRQFTRPSNPRALYYNDQVAVGYIRGSPFLELAAHDPEQGVVFYTLDQRAAERPAFSHQTSCLQCHVASGTVEVPGFLTRSIATGIDGSPQVRQGVISADHRTPFADRWAGWYVTGAGPGLVHRGNAAIAADGSPVALVPRTPAPRTSLEGAIDLHGYLATSSDVVALALFDHQAHALNLITRLAWEARVAAHEGRPDLTAAPIAPLVGDLADYLTFVDDAPLPAALDAPSPFAVRLAAEGPADASGRSLRRLNLRTRLLEYPCSYVVTSPAFDALPEALRRAVYQAIAANLTAATPRRRLAGVPRAVRLAALDILRAIKPDARDLLGPSSGR